MSDRPETTRLPVGGAVVTGASGGIGAAVRRRLAADFHPVVGIDVTAPSAADPHFVVADVRDQGWPRAALELLGDAGLSAAVHCAGVLLDRRLLDTDHGELLRVLDVNVVGSHATVAGLAPAMAPGGAFVVLSSQLAHQPRADRGAYRASKTALESLVQDYARELAPLGLRVVGLAPGPVLTPMTRKTLEDGREVAARMASGRLLEPGEVADVAAFLVSPAAAAITGSTVIADGGYLALGN